MAIHSVTTLINQNEEIIEYYKNAETIWMEIWKDYRSMNTESLAALLSHNQLSFEHNCGGKHLGQEVMVWSGFGRLYDTYAGFEGENKEKALMLKEAFKKSMCSFEVKDVVKSATNAFYLE
jgi:hypothetical protein